MSRRTYDGGRVVEEWDDATRTYRQFDVSGAVVEERPYTQDEAAGLVASDEALVEESNRQVIAAKALQALTANAGDLTQDDNVISQAQAIVDNPATNLTTTQIVGVLKDLARGLVIVAGNDANAKKELNALIRLVLGELDSTAGT